MEDMTIRQRYHFPTSMVTVGRNCMLTNIILLRSVVALVTSKLWSTQLVTLSRDSSAESLRIPRSRRSLDNAKRGHDSRKTMMLPKMDVFSQIATSSSPDQAKDGWGERGNKDGEVRGVRVYNNQQWTRRTKTQSKLRQSKLTGAHAKMIAQAMGGRGETKMEERWGWYYTTINNELTGARAKPKR